VGRSAPLDATRWRSCSGLREVEQQFKRLQMEHDLLKKLSVCLRSKAEVFAFIAANRGSYSIQMMCALYGVNARRFLRLAVAPAQCAV
jgi:hypothetical protein